MKKVVLKHIAAVTCLGLLMTCVACGPGLMMPTQTVKDAKPDKALITFVRATKFGGASEFHIWDSMEYVGTIKGGQYIQREITPGEHMFIVHAQNWAYIKANLEAGKKYYIVLNVSVGFTHAMAVPVMVTKDQTKYSQADIDSWMTGLKPITPNPEGSAKFVESRMPQVQQAVEKGKSPDTQFQILNPQDSWN